MKKMRFMFSLPGMIIVSVVSIWEGTFQLYAYPPGVGILSKSKNCLACHANNGPWNSESKIVVDIIEKDSKKSFRQPDGTFLLQVKRNEQLTVRTVIGYRKNPNETAPYRNGWIYIDPATIESTSLSKFASGWDVNLQMACRVVGDALDGVEDANVTVLPMTIRPSDAARDAKIVLQFMLTRGESVKGKGKEGMIGNYFERSVTLKVID